MRPAILIAALVSCAGVLHAQEATPKSDDFHSGVVSFGAMQTDSDTLSSKFQEYREVPNGAIAPFFRFEGKKGDLRYDVFGLNVQQKDQRFWGRMGTDTFRLDADYNRIPHNFGNAGRTLLEQAAPGVWLLSDSVQRAYQTAIEAVPRSSVNFLFLNNLLSPGLASANVIDLGLTRERGNLAFRLTPTDQFEAKVLYSRERRVGDRAASGTAFGFGNVVELPEAVHYLVQDVGAEAEVRGDWGVLRGGLHYNWFNNRIPTFSFDNPFRILNSTDASAYQAPGSASTGGAVVGLMALPPDNQAFTGNVGATLKLPSRTRISADVSIGTWKQDETPFIGYTTNTTIPTPALPARKLDGKMNVKSLAASVTSQPAAGFTLTGRARIYDLDNETPRIALPGYVRYEGVWEDIPRISVPYSFKNDRFDFTASYDFGKLSLEGGFRHAKMERTFRETEDTKENGFSVAADLRPADGVLVRASYEKAERDYEHLEIELSEEASFQQPGAVANLMAIPPPSENPAYAATFASLCPGGVVCNLRYDQAKKDVDRIGASVQVTPGSGKVSFQVSYLRTKDDYKESRFGLTKAEFDSFGAQVDLTPSERASLYAFYSYEKLADSQRGRQSGATVSANVLDDWTSEVDDKVNSFGAGGNFVLEPDKWTFGVFGQYQEVDGNNDIFAAPGGAPFNARTGVGGVQDIPLYDDTKILSVNAELKYQVSKAWAFALGGWFEDYEIKDSNTGGLLNYVPGTLFLSANDGDYQAKWVYVRASYTW